MTAKKRLSNFDFSGGQAAMALVSKDVGGPANGIKTLQMKAADVTLELSMEEFLRKFFGMWYDDAEFLAKLLGYEVEDESYLQYHSLTDKVTLMKSLKGSADLSKTISVLSEDQLAELEKITKSLADAMGFKLKDSEGVNKSSDDVTPKTPKEEFEMNETEVQEMIQKATEAAVAKALADQNEKHEAQLETLNKSLAQMEADKEAEVVAQYVVKANDYKDLVEGFDAAVMGKAIRKAEQDSELEMLMKALSGALKVAKNTDALEEQGHEVVEADVESGVMAVIKAQKASK